MTSVMSAKENGKSSSKTCTATISLTGDTARMFEMFKDVYEKIPRSFDLQTPGPYLDNPPPQPAPKPPSSSSSTTSSSISSGNGKQQSNSTDPDINVTPLEQKTAGTKSNKEQTKKRPKTEDSAANASDQQSNSNNNDSNQRQQSQQHQKKQRHQKVSKQTSSKSEREKNFYAHSYPMAMPDSMLPALFTEFSASLTPEAISSLTSSMLNALPSELASLAKDLQAGRPPPPPPPSTKPNTLALISPAMPLHFETYQTSLHYRFKHDMENIGDCTFFYPPDSYLQSHVERALLSSIVNQQRTVEKIIMDEVAILEAQLGEPKDKNVNHDTFLHAHIKALGAYALGADSKSRQKAIREAKEALVISDAVCVDAYVVLALYESNSYEEALSLFKKGIEVARAMSDTLEEDDYNGDMWTKTHLRGYLRCVHGVASTYRKMGKYEDALKMYLRLEELDPHSNGYTCFVNWRYHVPEVFMRLGRWLEARQYMNKHKEEFELGSTNTSFLWSQALCDYCLGAEDWCKEYFRDSARTNATEGAILKAIQQHSYVLEYLVGKLRLSDTAMSMELVTCATKVGEVNCALYASSNLDLWYNTPGAVEYALRHFNTFVAMFLIQGEKEALRVFGLTKVKTKKQFLDICVDPVGIYGDAVVSPEGLTLLHEAVTKPKDDYEFALGLLKNGASLDTNFYLTPAHMAAYYDAHVITIEAFLDHGMDPMDKGPSNSSPLHMSANQGNWLVLDCILRRCPHLRTKKILDNLGSTLLDSSVYECLNGTSTCQRCRSEDMPHSKNASIEKCIDVLFKWGWEPSRRIISEGSGSRGKRSLELHLRKRITQIKNRSIERGQLAPLPKKIQNELKRSTSGNSSNANNDSKSKKKEGQQPHHEQATKIPDNGKKTKENVNDKANDESNSGDGNNSSSSPSKNKCAVCGKTGRLLRCANCKTVLYCGTLCQKQHWKTHRFECGK